MTVADRNALPPEDKSVNETVDGAPDLHPAARMSMDMTSPEGDQIPIAITPPYLQIAHGISDLCNKMGFPPGALILGKENLIAQPAGPKCPGGESLKVVILKYQTYYKEYAYVKGQISKVFATAPEAHAAGFTTEYNPITGVQPTCPPAMTWLMLIEKPKDLMCELFFLDVMGRQYAPCFFGVDKMAFRAVKDTFFLNAKVAAAGRGIRSLEWELKTKIQVIRSTQKEAWVPSIKRLRAIPEAELQEFMKAAMMLGGQMPNNEPVEAAPVTQPVQTATVQQDLPVATKPAE